MYVFSGQKLNILRLFTIEWVSIYTSTHSILSSKENINTLDVIDTENSNFTFEELKDKNITLLVSFDRSSRRISDILTNTSE
jgi:hypothetical protein